MQFHLYYFCYLFCVSASHVYSDPGTDVYFRLPRHTDPSHLLSAKLHVYVRGSRSGRDTSAILLIQVINPVERTANIIRKKKLPVGSYRHGEWLQFSVLELVRHWADQPLSNNGLRIEAYDEVTGENLALVQGRTQGEAAYVCVMVLLRMLKPLVITKLKQPLL